MARVTDNTTPIATPEHTVDGFVREFLRELNFGQGTDLTRASVNDKYLAMARTVRHYLMVRWLATLRRQYQLQAKSVAYLSAEFLLGRQLDNALLAADLDEVVEEGLASLGIDLAELREAEVEPGLGNGGLGRLAACFIDSLATMNVPCIGYGIRYEYGIFRQTFVDGWQVEKPDNWLALGSPWEFPHPESAVTVDFGGHTEQYTDESGTTRSRWVPGWSVLGVPYNYMVPGFENGRVNTLRLWSARATRAFDLEIFNAGDYAQAVRAQTFAENISKVLYPEDSTPQGKELRLQQQYFFVACSLRDFLDQVLPHDFDLRNLPDRIVFQLNDTHPVIAIPELMRILVDERGWEWSEAWAITQKCFAYTCHTLLPEALEVWSVELLGKLLPRHLEIIYRINEDFMAELREAYPDDELRVRRMSIIAEYPERAVRMAYLATVAGSKVNGVAALHSQLLKDKVLHDFSDHYPDKFTNVTNGVTPRRFVRLANPGLSELITSAIGDGWVTDLDKLQELEPLADDADFRAAFRQVKRANKLRLVDVLAERDGITVDPDTMLDVMVKRLHEYKRQTLKLLHVVTLYDQVTSGAVKIEDVTPRTFAFGAKAAPGYRMAKQTIADQRGRPGRQQRPRAAGPAHGRVPGQLQRDARREAHPRGGPVGADLARRQGGVGDGQHEVRAQRGPDHRHRRRRERRDPRARRRRQLLPVRPAGARGRGDRGPRVPPDVLLRGEPLPAARARPHRVRGVLGRRPGDVRAHRVQPAVRGPVPGPRRLPGVHRRPGAGRRGVRGHRGVDAFGGAQRGPVGLLLLRPQHA